MSSKLEIILQKMDIVIQKASTIHVGQHSHNSDELIAEINTSMHSIIHRFSPAGSPYAVNAQALVNNYQVTNDYIIKFMLGVLKSLRADYASGNLLTIQELIHGDVFSDFLDMANHLEQEGYKDPAAVLAGSTLEEHLRKLCIKNNIQITKPDGSPKKADLMNNELGTVNVFTKLDQKSVTAWLDLRNKAAHGRYTEYTKEQVVLLISGVRDFLTRNPA